MRKTHLAKNGNSETLQPVTHTDVLFFTFNHSGFLQMRCIRAVGHHKCSSSALVRRGDNESLEASDDRSSGQPSCLRVQAEGETIGAAADSQCHAVRSCVRGMRHLCPAHTADN